MELKNKTILLISPNKWGRMRISKHHYAMELARENTVFFLNPPDIAHRGDITVQPVPEADSLRVVSYRPIFRGKRFLPPVLYQCLIRRQIRDIQRRLDLPIDLLWSFSATHFTNLRWFDASFRIYHPVDELMDESQIHIGNTSDLVLTCTEHIRNQLQGVGAPVHLVPHGLAEPFAERARARLTSAVAGDIVREPKFGYSGNLFSEFLDRGRFREIIQLHPEIRFHFWGPLRPSDSNVSAWVTEESLAFIRFLEEARNAVLHGVVEQTDLASQLGLMDGFLVLYRPDVPHFSVSDSHKILEYLSTGKVIVASHLIDGGKYNGLMEMSSEKDNRAFNLLFESVTAKIDHYNAPVLSGPRIKFALRYTYRENLTRVANLISAATVERGGASDEQNLDW